MKTIEEKAKAYDEAIERAKNFIENGDERERTIAESIFAGLMEENEDERIRKGIIRCVKGNMPDNDFRKKYIAWLEKQGAKVSAIEGFETEFERQVSSLIASTINKEHEYNQGYVKWTANALLNYAKHELEKQGEQKPADNKEMNIDEEFINALGTMLNDRLPDRYLVSEERIKESAELLFSIARKQLKNEKQEWSKEDKVMLDEIIDFFENGTVKLQHDLSLYASWLKSLRPQPQWKPSDEQMKALAEALSLANNCGEECAFDLRTLYEQLKKLMEE